MPGVKTGRCQLHSPASQNILQQMAELSDQDPEYVLESAHLIFLFFIPPPTPPPPPPLVMLWIVYHGKVKHMCGTAFHIFLITSGRNKTALKKIALLQLFMDSAHQQIYCLDFYAFIMWCFQCLISVYLHLNAAHKHTANDVFLFSSRSTGSMKMRWDFNLTCLPLSSRGCFTTWPLSGSATLEDKTVSVCYQCVVIFKSATQLAWDLLQLLF